MQALYLVWLPNSPMLFSRRLDVASPFLSKLEIYWECVFECLWASGTYVSLLPTLCQVPIYPLSKTFLCDHQLNNGSSNGAAQIPVLEAIQHKIPLYALTYSTLSTSMYQSTFVGNIEKTGRIREKGKRVKG